jgi:hypothetical protein
MDIDLIVARDRENEAKVFSALSTLPDNAARELQPGELLQYNVIRVADEVLVDLMGSAGGIDYGQAARQAEIREVERCGYSLCLSGPALADESDNAPGERPAGSLVPASVVCQPGREAPARLIADRTCGNHRCLRALSFVSIS